MKLTIPTPPPQGCVCTTESIVCVQVSQNPVCASEAPTGKVGGQFRFSPNATSLHALTPSHCMCQRPALQTTQTTRHPVFCKCILYAFNLVAA